MPPASESLLLQARLRLLAFHIRQYASLSTPKPPKANFLKRVRSQQSPKQQSSKEAENASKSQPNPEDTSHTRQQDQFRRFMPAWLRERPFLRNSIAAFAMTVPISAFVLLHFPYEPRRVTGPSMKPTINADCESDNDAAYSPTWVLVRRWDTNAIREVRKQQLSQKGSKTASSRWGRGDIVVYDTPHDPDKVAVKRIVAVAGDTIVPMKGYPGGEEPVVIPYNHVWVEGDANDRKKSVDSNYFGPIARPLIKGRVVAMWSPWWNIFGIKGVDKWNATWPAKTQNRVNEQAVEVAAVDPNHAEKFKPFEGDLGEKTLRWVRERQREIEDRFAKDEQYRAQMYDFFVHAVIVGRTNPDPETKERGRIIVRELEHLLGQKAILAAKPMKQRRDPGELPEDLFKTAT